MPSTTAVPRIGRRTARRAARSPAVRAAARGGFAARGVIYLLVGVLALRIAFGDSGGQADRGGALAEIAARPFGNVLIWALGLGLAGMALWRLSEAGFGAAGPEGHKAGTRLLSLARCLFYAVVAFSVLSFAAGKQGSGSGASDQQSRDATAKALDLPGGPWLVAAAGVGIAVVGIWIAVRAILRKFHENLDRSGMSHRVRRGIDVLGVAGGIARGAVFAVSRHVRRQGRGHLRPRQGQGHGRHAPLPRRHLGRSLAAGRHRRRSGPVRRLLLRDGPVAQRLNRRGRPRRPAESSQHVRHVHPHPAPPPHDRSPRRMTETHQNAPAAAPSFARRPSYEAAAGTSKSPVSTANPTPATPKPCSSHCGPPRRRPTAALSPPPPSAKSCATTASLSPTPAGAPAAGPPPATGAVTPPRATRRTRRPLDVPPVPGPPEGITPSR